MLIRNDFYEKRKAFLEERNSTFLLGAANLDDLQGRIKCSSNYRRTNCLLRMLDARLGRIWDQYKADNKKEIKALVDRFTEQTGKVQYALRKLRNGIDDAVDESLDKDATMVIWCEAIGLARRRLKAEEKRQYQAKSRA